MCKTCVLNAGTTCTNLRTKPVLSAGKFVKKFVVGKSASFTSFYTLAVRHVVHMNCSLNSSVKELLSTMSTVPTNTPTKLNLINNIVNT